MGKFLRLIGIVGLAFCLFGCGTSLYSYRQGSAPSHISHPRNIPVWLDARFTPAQDKELEDAVAEWNGVFNGQIVLKLQVQDGMENGKVVKQLVTFPDTDAAKELIAASTKSDLGIVIMALADDDPVLEGMDVESVLAFVPGFDEHYVVVLKDHLGERSLKDIVMHEIGHLMGAGHVTSPSLMFPVYGGNQSTCIDKVTVLEVANFWHLDPATLNYCSTPAYP